MIEKTGQSIDVLKEEILIPEVSALIQSQFLNIPQYLTCMDIGTGDATSFLRLLDDLEKGEIYSPRRAFIDYSTKIFPSILENIDIGNSESKNLFVCEPDKDLGFGPELSFYEQSADFITAQMVFHQIRNDSELTLLLCRSFLALKDEGCLYITDFHPEYIEYLIAREPSKFVLTSSIQKDRVEGNYFFDSGGTVPIVMRDMVTLASMLLTTGFHIRKIVKPSLVEITKTKERYKTLQEENIPMFVILQVEKRPERFVSYTSGVVRKVEVRDRKSMKITLRDKEFVILPISKRWEDLKYGDELILLETVLPNEKTCCQMWVVPKKGGNGIWSTRWINTQ